MGAGASADADSGGGSGADALGVSSGSPHAIAHRFFIILHSRMGMTIELPTDLT